MRRLRQTADDDAVEEPAIRAVTEGQHPTLRAGLEARFVVPADEGLAEVRGIRPLQSVKRAEPGLIDEQLLLLCRKNRRKFRIASTTQRIGESEGFFEMPLDRDFDELSSQ